MAHDHNPHRFIAGKDDREIGPGFQVGARKAIGNGIIGAVRKRVPQEGIGFLFFERGQQRPDVLPLAGLCLRCERHHFQRAEDGFQLSVRFRNQDIQGKVSLCSSRHRNPRYRSRHRSVFFPDGIKCPVLLQRIESVLPAGYHAVRGVITECNV